MNRTAPHITHHTSQRGLTLVEVMVAITVSLILLAGVSKIFVSSKQSYRVQEGLARLQENGRFAMDFLSNDIRMAGYTGCASKAASIRNIVAPPNDTVSFTGGIQGYEYTSLPVTLSATDTLNSSNVVANTDAVVIKRASPSGVRLTGNMDVDNANLQIDPSAAGLFAADDILFISDCANADVFAATSVSAGAGKITIAHANSTNTDNRLSKAYQKDADIMKMESLAYYLGIDAANNNAPTLYRKRLVTGFGMVTEPLVENVENMQILYGEDTDAPGDGSANRYLPANAAGLNTNNIVSVRLSLLLRSAEDGLTTQPQAYTFNGTTTTPADRRLRRVFTTTIQIRNRGL